MGARGRARDARYARELTSVVMSSTEGNRYRVPLTCSVHAIAPAIYAPTWQWYTSYGMFGETCATREPARRPEMHKRALAGRRTAGCFAPSPVLSRSPSPPSTGLSFQLLALTPCSPRQLSLPSLSLSSLPPRRLPKIPLTPFASPFRSGAL